MKLPKAKAENLPERNFKNETSNAADKAYDGQMSFQARSENIVISEAGGETMVYDILTNKAYLLNETSAFVWQMCDGKRDLDEISRALAEKTDQPVNKDIVKLAIDQLKTSNLLDQPKSIKDFFTNTSRRNVIRQVGLATMIALPGIFQLAAPKAANAASRRNIAACQYCTLDRECASGKCSQRANYDYSICNDGTGPTTGDVYDEVGAPNGTDCSAVAGSCCTNRAQYYEFWGQRGCICSP